MEEKTRCSRVQRWRTHVLLCIGFIVFFKVVWMTLGETDGPLHIQFPREDIQWVRDYQFNISALLEAHRAQRTVHMRNSTTTDFRLDPPKYSRRRNNPRLQEINCPAMFANDKAEIERAKQRMLREPQKKVSSEEYLHKLNNCEDFKKERGYITTPLSPEEEHFPIAFSILMYDDVEQVERLLRAVYHPQNVYCVHVDVKASILVHQTMRSLVRCFPNVFIASRLVSVFWGHVSILHAEMSCMRDLLRYDWRYFINLSGQMFPLHTNRELVNILQLYDGANDIEGTYKRSRKIWIMLRQLFSWRLMESWSTMMITIYPKSAAPHNVTVYKGSNQMAATRAFVVYFMHSQISRDLLEWFSDTLAPDEYMWPTLNHNPHLHVPGSYKGDPETKTFTARASIWVPLADQINWSWEHWDCQGKWVREICVFGVGDLPWLHSRPEFFANKFHSSFEWLAYDCMEELIYNRTVEGQENIFDPTYYKNLPFVKYKDKLVVSVNEATNRSGMR